MVRVVLLRATLIAFALLNAGFWAAMVAVWSWRPVWADRLPLQLGTPGGSQSYPKAGSSWARLGAALSGFWIAAAGLYLVGGRLASAGAVIVLFVIASIFLIIATVASGTVLRMLGHADHSPAAARRREQAL